MKSLSKETRQLREAIKILLRDGKEGRLFDAAKARFEALYSDALISEMATEMDGIDLTKEIKADVDKIRKMIGGTK